MPEKQTAHDIVDTAVAAGSFKTLATALTSAGLRQAARRNNRDPAAAGEQRKTAWHPDLSRGAGKGNGRRCRHPAVGKNRKWQVFEDCYSQRRCHSRCRERGQDRHPLHQRRDSRHRFRCPPSITFAKMLQVFSKLKTSRAIEVGFLEETPVRGWHKTTKCHPYFFGYPRKGLPALR
jgi:hypothetical protein